MSIYKRGDVYWYEFVFKGKRVRDTTCTGNKEAAGRSRGREEDGVSQ